MPARAKTVTSHSRAVEARPPENEEYAILHNDHFHLGYFAHRDLDLPASQEQHVEALFRHLCPAPTDLVVDVGCGLGNTARWVRERYGSDVVGIDIFESVLRRSRSRDRLPLARGDMAQLPFRSASVDLIVGVESVYGVPQRGRVFAEFARVLRPGGTLLLSDFVLGDNPRRMYTGLVSAVAQAETLEPEATYRAKLGAAGFDDISFADVGEHTALATAEHLRAHAALRHDLARAQLGRVRGAVFSTIAFPLGYKLWCRAFAQRRTRHVFITACRS